MRGRRDQRMKVVLVEVIEHQDYFESIEDRFSIKEMSKLKRLVIEQEKAERRKNIVIKRVIPVGEKKNKGFKKF